MPLGQPTKDDVQRDFNFAMAQLGTCHTIMSAFPWQKLLDDISHAEGAGAVLNPKMFIDIQKDDQWEMKRRVFTAAADFVRTMNAVSDELAKEEAGEHQLTVEGK